MNSRLTERMLILLIFALAALAPAMGIHAQSVELKIMSFNVWSAENTQSGRNKLVQIIQAADADIIGVQEMGNSSGQSIASALGFHYSQQSGSDIQTISRFPIVGQSASNFGVLIAIEPGNHVWLFNAHLAPYPYQPYDLRDGNLPPNEAAVIAAAEAARGAEINNILIDMQASLLSETPVFLTGDFNEPSHLDWTQAAADATTRPFDLKVEYPAAKKITNAGLTDSFRALRADEVNDTGYTWTPGYPPPNLNADEVHDRIDMVYYSGDTVVPMSAETVSLDASNVNTDIAVPGYNSDHRAVVSSFTVFRPTGGTLLTFAGLTHNPGNASALNASNYGDRWVNTPNLVIAFSATGTSTWDTYEGDEDNNGVNNWNGGVAQLQFGNGSAEYDIAITPDDGFGVIVDTFDLADYVGFAAGHTVNWELWSGQPNVGSLLSNGQVIIPANAIVPVSTSYDTPVKGLVTLRIEHLAGDGTDLAVDNVAFRQSPGTETEFTADSYQEIRGTLVSGTLADTFVSDDMYLSYHPENPLLPAEEPVWLVFDGTLSTDSPSLLGLQLEASANTVGLVQIIEMFNWNFGQYEEVSSAAASANNDSVQTIELTAQVSDYVQSGTGKVRTRIGWRQDGLVLFHPWTVRIDRAIWTTN